MKTKSHNILSNFTGLCQATFIGILGHRWPAGCGLDTDALEGRGAEGRQTSRNMVAEVKEKDQKSQ